MLTLRIGAGRVRGAFLGGNLSLTISNRDTSCVHSMLDRRVRTVRRERRTKTRVFDRTNACTPSLKILKTMVKLVTTLNGVRSAADLNRTVDTTFMTALLKVFANCIF